MQKANPVTIGWCDWTSNPIRCKCRHRCEYCYMQSFYRRRPDMWPVEPEYHGQAYKGITSKQPRRIWFGSSTDMFGEWVPGGLIESVIETCEAYPQHIYYVLTKNPQRYAEFTFPENCWLGVTLDYATEDVLLRAGEFHAIGAHRHQTFVSCEPLLGNLAIPGGILSLSDPSWVIVGADSNKGANPPEREWVDRIVQFADDWRIPVFIKRNLADKFPKAPWANRRERP